MKEEKRKKKSQIRNLKQIQNPKEENLKRAV
jgi:hypothetical protein